MRLGKHQIRDQAWKFPAACSMLHNTWPSSLTVPVNILHLVLSQVKHLYFRLHSTPSLAVSNLNNLLAVTKFADDAHKIVRIIAHCRAGSVLRLTKAFNFESLSKNQSASTQQRIRVYICPHSSCCWMTLLITILGTSLTCLRVSPVTGDVWRCSSHFCMAAFSYVCPSAAMTGSSIGACL